MAKKRNTYKGGPKHKFYEDLFTGPLSFQHIDLQLIKAYRVEDKTLRSEYSRLRAIANKRIQRMEGKPIAEATYERIPGLFPTVRGMNREQVVHELIRLTRFLNAERGSLSGIKESNKKIQKGLAEKGIIVPDDQLRNFGSFMNAMKKALGAGNPDYDSGQTANLWQDLFNKGKISGAEFERRVKDLMREANATPKQKKEVRKLIMDAPIDKFFDDISLDPRTIKARDKRDQRSQENARQASRRATVKRRQRRNE